MNSLLRHTSRVLLVLAMFVLAGCNESGADSNSQSPPAVVVVSPPVQESVVDYVDYTGRTESAETVEIRARVTGFLKAIFFKEGAEVAKDAPLFQIDDREFQADLEAAKAEVATAAAKREKATMDLDRAEKLRKKDAISAAMYDQVVSDKK